MYGEFECALFPLSDIIDTVPNTKKYQVHIVCSCGYNLVCVYELYSKPYKAYFGEDAIKTFFKHFLNYWMI